MTNATIKIFVTNLGKYNEGELVGEWLSLPATEDEIAATLDKIGIDDVYDECELEALNAYLDAVDKDLDAALDCIEGGEYCFYPNMDIEDVAAELVEEGYFGEIPESIAYYIDYEAIARDLSIDNYYDASNGVISVY